MYVPIQILAPKKAVSNFRTLRHASRHFDTSLWFQVRRALRLRYRSLFTLSEMMDWGLTDPAISSAQIDKYLSVRARDRVIARTNAYHNATEVHDKTRTYLRCKRGQVPVPKMHGMLRGEPDRPSGGDQMYSVPNVDWAEVPNGPLVAKPVCGMQGRAVVFLEKQGEWLQRGDKRIRTAEVSKYLRQEAAKDETLLAFAKYVGLPAFDFLVQERLTPHPALAALCGGDGMQCVRVVTYLDSSGEVHIPFSCFKFLRRGGLIDNFHLGNLLASLDPDTGRVKTVHHKVRGQIGLETIIPPSGHGRILRRRDRTPLGGGQDGREKGGLGV